MFGQTPARCPICSSSRLEIAWHTPHLNVARCSCCGHCVAKHTSCPPQLAEIEYHEQYDQGDYLEALQQTRLRQSERILRLIKEYQPEALRLLDFGCGRGWLLRRARHFGFAHLAGADSSVLAIKTLKENGIEGILIPPMLETPFPSDQLSFQPEVLTVLDVIEHIQPPHLGSVLQSLLQGLKPALKLVVIKAPVSSGLLYKTARFLSALRIFGPVEQLYQVGTFPAHYSYFSRRSIELLAGQVGLGVIHKEFDRDFEPSQLSRRVRSLGWLGPFARIPGAAATFVIDLFGIQDAVVIIARVTTNQGNRMRDSHQCPT